MFNKNKVQSLFKEILMSILYGLIINILINAIAIVVYSLKFGLFPEKTLLTIYFTTIGVLFTGYALLLSISTNLSEEIPYNLSLKYIVFSQTSLSYFTTILINIFIVLSFSYAFLSNELLKGISNTLITSSTAVLLIGAFIFIFIILKKFNLEDLLKLLVEDTLGNDTDIKPNLSKKYITFQNKDEETVVIYTKDFEEKKTFIEGNELHVDDFDYEYYTKTAKPKMFNLPIIYFGKLSITDWSFLENIKSPFRLILKKYNYKDDVAVSFEFFPNSKDKQENIEELLKENIIYNPLNINEIKEVYFKLKYKKNEDKLIRLIHKYIITENKREKKQFLFRNFKDLFELHISEQKNVKDKISYLYESHKHYSNFPYIILRLQNNLKTILMDEFKKVDNNNDVLFTASLFIKEFMYIRNMSKFELSDDKEWKTQYYLLMRNTIDNIHSICEFVIQSDKEEKDKLELLRRQIEVFNDLENTFSYIKTQKHLGKTLHNKMGRVDEIQNYYNEKRLELFYIILYCIDNGKIEKMRDDFFNLALEFLKIQSFKHTYYEKIDFRKLDLLSYDRFVGGARTIKEFNANKYRLLISFYNFIKGADLDVNNFDKKSFTFNLLDGALNEFTHDFVKKYIGYFKKRDFNNFKKEVEKILKNNKKKEEKEKNNYIIEAPLLDKYKKRFEADCKNKWQEYQNRLEEFINIRNIQRDNKKIKLFDLNVLFPKEFFLEPFDENVSLFRGGGEDIGIDVGRKKEKIVFENIEKLSEKRNDKEIKVKDLNADIKEYIEPNKNYFLLYNLTEFMNLPYESEMYIDKYGYQKERIHFNNSNVYLIQSLPSIKGNLLFEEDTFILKQYLLKDNEGNSGFILVNVGELEKDEIKKLAKEKDVEESKLQQKVKIRIWEKFKVERKNNKKLIKLKVMSE